MPINSTHPHYDAKTKFWARCRHVIEGEDSVKEHADDAGYLPMLEGQDTTDYASYLNRSMFYNASGRTVQAVIGAIFRKPVVVKPEITDGNDRPVAKIIEQHCREAVEQVMSTGRFGILADMPQVTEPGEVAEPYAVVYRAEQITNWRFDSMGDKERLTLVVLHETDWASSPEDPYMLDEQERYRELFIGVDGNYRQRLWTKVKNADTGKEDWSIESEVMPLALGAPLTEIPFAMANWSSCSCEVKNPPLLDLINVNLSHFRTSADLEHGRHFTALPTAWVAGFDAKTELKIGSSTAWVTENPSAHAGYLEFTGAGLGHLADALKEKAELMAILGARLFMPADRAGVEAAETVRLRQSADTANAQSVANVVGDAMTEVFKWMLAFIRGVNPAEASVELNNDVLDTPLDIGSIQTLFMLMQSGGISHDTFLYNLQRGEVLPPDRTVEDEKSLIELDDGRFARGEFRFAMQNPAEQASIEQQNAARAAPSKGE